MPQIVEIKELDGDIWIRVPKDSYKGELTLWSNDEIKDHANASVRDFLIDLFHQWKDRL